MSFRSISLRVRLLLPVLLALVSTVGLAFSAPVDQPRLATLALAVAGAIVVAWLVNHLMIVRPARQLVAAARQLGRGDLGARTGLRRGSDEIAELAATFDEMAASLEARELALRVAQAELATVLDLAAEAIITADEDGQIRLFNDAAEAAFGYAATEVLGTPLAGLLPLTLNIPASPPLTVRHEVIARRRDGSTFPAEVSIASLQGASVATVTVILRDITERKQAENELLAAKADLERRVDERTTALRRANQQLRHELAERLRVEEALLASEERLRTVVASAPIILFALDPTGTVSFADGAGLVALGLTPDELIDHATQVLASDESSLRRQFGRALTGEAFTAMTEVGDVVLQIQYSPQFSDQGDLTGVIGVATDITERRRAEAETLAALCRAEMLLTTSSALNDGSTEEAVRQIIVESAASLVDGSNAVLWMSDDGPGLRGVAATAGLVALIGQRGPWWEGEIGADASPFAGRDIAGLSTVVPLMIGPSLLGMVSIHHPSDRPPSLQEHTLLRAFANHAATALRNIRLREELAHSLASLAARTRLLEDKTHEQEVFIYTVAHDLKAPLVSLQGLTSILMADYGERLDDEGQRYLDRIIANAEKLQGLIRDLLEISRIGRVDADCQAVNLGSLVTDVVERLRHTLDARGAIVTIEPPLPTVWANPTRLAQVFSNLIDNAATYTPPERAPRIAIRASERPDEWELSVADNGIGIPSTMQERIFGVFQRLPSAKALNPQGSGVGLTIVARIIETHGGHYWLTSEEGVGTTFTFTLPQPAVTTLPATTLAGVAG